MKKQLLKHFLTIFEPTTLKKNSFLKSYKFPSCLLKKCFSNHVQSMSETMLKFGCISMSPTNFSRIRFISLYLSKIIRKYIDFPRHTLQISYFDSCILKIIVSILSLSLNLTSIKNLQKRK